MVVISLIQLAQLLNTLGILNLELKKEPLTGVAGDRKAAKDCTQLLGRVVAAAAYGEPIDSQYLLYVKDWEKKAVYIAERAAKQVVSDSIKSI